MPLKNSAEKNALPILMDASEGFPPIVGDQPQVLVLGSLPGVKSIEEQRYYAHPRNVFWPIMSDLLSLPDDYQGRCDGVIAARIAVWDVLQQSIRPGSLDSAIRIDDAIANDFEAFLTHNASIELIGFNGKKAESLFQSIVIPTLTRKPDTLALPSTSPAYAAMPYATKLQRWRSAIWPVLENRKGET